MSNKNLEDLQIEHFKRTVAESDREKAKEKRRLEATAGKLKDLISLTSSLDFKVKKLFLYLGAGLLSLGLMGSIIIFMVSKLNENNANTSAFVAAVIFAILFVISLVLGLVFIVLYIKQDVSKTKKLLATAKEATNIGKQVINTLTAYQFADEENMQGTISNIESYFSINLKNDKRQLRTMGNSILNELIILNKQAKTMLERVNDDLVEI